jgi:hypothetical protein
MTMPATPTPPDGIKPIETQYAGCRFRSRLEARWAVFFDHLGIRWEYEPQGFELPSGARYLPDFHLPDLDLWVEVKGSEEAFLADGARYAEAAYTGAMGGSGLLILGPVPDLRLGEPQHFVLTAKEHCCGQRVLCLDIVFAELLTSPDNLRRYGLACTDLISHEVGELPPLGTYAINQSRYTQCRPMPTTWPLPPRASLAYTAARSARFEHGECG